MPRKKTSKAEHIRQALSSLGSDARSKDVIAAVAAKKVKVSSAMVANVRARLKGGEGATKARRGKDGRFRMADLLAAKRLADQLGLDRAREALATLAKLR